MRFALKITLYTVITLLYIVAATALLFVGGWLLLPLIGWWIVLYAIIAIALWIFGGVLVSEGLLGE